MSIFSKPRSIAQFPMDNATMNHDKLLNLRGFALNIGIVNTLVVFEPILIA